MIYLASIKNNVRLSNSVVLPTESWANIALTFFKGDRCYNALQAIIQTVAVGATPFIGVLVLIYPQWRCRDMQLPLSQNSTLTHIVYTTVISQCVYLSLCFIYRTLFTAIDTSCTWTCDRFLLYI